MQFEDCERRLKESQRTLEINEDRLQKMDAEQDRLAIDLKVDALVTDSILMFL